MNPTRTTTTYISRPSHAGWDSAAATVTIDTAVLSISSVSLRPSKTSGNSFENFFLWIVTRYGSEPPRLQFCSLLCSKPQEVNKQCLNLMLLWRFASTKQTKSVLNI